MRDSVESEGKGDRHDAAALGAFGCLVAPMQQRWAHGNAEGQTGRGSVGRMATPRGRQGAAALAALGSREAANAEARPNSVGSVGSVGMPQGARQRRGAANGRVRQRLRCAVGSRPEAVGQRVLWG